MFTKENSQQFSFVFTNNYFMKLTDEFSQKIVSHFCRGFDDVTNEVTLKRGYSMDRTYQ